jgi:SAM-dependent methyltransferase
LGDDSRDSIEHHTERLLRASGYARTGFAHGYDSYRPSPPSALLDILCLEAQVERPRQIVDLGSGTGLSTRAWAERADDVVGVEASPEMRSRAEKTTSAGNVRFVQAYAQETGLAAGTADIVTCSQSFHWMEPVATLAEAARLLRLGGIFAAYDYDWPPIVHPDVEAAFEELVRRIGMRRALRGQPRHTKDMHLDRIRESGHFRFVREVLLHSEERGSAERVIGMALSLGPLSVMLNEGVSEEELGLAQLREAAAAALGDREVEIFLSYRVRLGVR